VILSEAIIDIEGYKLKSPFFREIDSDFSEKFSDFSEKISDNI